MFIVPYILVIYIRLNVLRDAHGFTYSLLPYTCSTCFGCYLHPSSGTQPAEYSRRFARFFHYLGHTEVSVQFWGFVCEYCVPKIRFHGEKLSGPSPTPKLEDHPLSAVRDCLFNIFTATFNIGGRSSTRHLRTRHALMTRIHLSHDKNPLITRQGPTYHMTGTHLSHDRDPLITWQGPTYLHDRDPLIYIYIYI
jgi:hypothetical protein